MLKLSWEFENILTFLNVPFTKHSEFVDDGAGVDDEMVHLEVDQKYALYIMQSLSSYVDIKRAENMSGLTADLF